MATIRERKTGTKATPVHTIAHLLLDSSGSMASGQEESIQAFNDYLEGLAKDKRTKDFSFTLTRFSTEGIHTTDEAVVPQDVELLTEENWIPRGGTPLYDAIAHVIELADEEQVKGDGVLIVIQTDGEENSSHKHTKADIQALVKRKTRAGWQFVYLGKGINAMHAGGALGIAPGSTISYDWASTGTAGTTLTAATIRYAAAGSSACTSFTGSENTVDLTAKGKGSTGG